MNELFSYLIRYNNGDLNKKKKPNNENIKIGLITFIVPAAIFRAPSFGIT